MPSTSHRKCQYQGEGCMGTAHAGHDQCAHCYFQYIKPALQVERAEVKRRRALKRRGHPTEGVMDNNARQEGGTLGYLDLDPDLQRPRPPRPSRAIREAIFDVNLDKMLEGKTPDQQLDIVVGEMLKDDLRDIPVLLPKPNQVIKKEDVPPTPELTENVEPLNAFKRSAAQHQEIADAYNAGQTIKEVCRAYEIDTATLYQILRHLDVPLRGQPARHTRRKPAPMPQSTPPVSAPKVETASPNGVVSGLTEWLVTYTVTRTETTVVQAKGFAEAAAAAGNLDPGIDVISVAKKRP